MKQDWTMDLKGHSFVSGDAPCINERTMAIASRIRIADVLKAYGVDGEPRKCEEMPIDHSITERAGFVSGDTCGITMESLDAGVKRSHREWMRMYHGVRGTQMDPEPTELPSKELSEEEQQEYMRLYRGVGGQNPPVEMIDVSSLEEKLEPHIHRTPITPTLAVDIVIEVLTENDRRLVLIERKYPPYGFALPGGHVDVGESTEAAAVREAFEETGLHVKLTSLLGVYSKPDRDPRRHVVSVVYTAQAEGQPIAGDDAKEVTLVSISNGWPRFEALLERKYAFDHKKILNDYINWSIMGDRPSLLSVS